MPGEAVMDLRIQKRVPLRARARVDLLIEFFNLFNRTTFTQVNRTWGPGAYPDNPLPTFGQFVEAAAAAAGAARSEGEFLSSGEISSPPSRVAGAARARGQRQNPPQEDRAFDPPPIFVPIEWLRSRITYLSSTPITGKHVWKELRGGGILRALPEGTAMVRVPSDDVTTLRIEWSDGNRSTLDRLIPAVYGDLRRVTGRSLRLVRPNHTLQPTLLVHEAYLRYRARDRGAAA